MCLLERVGGGLLVEVDVEPGVVEDERGACCDRQVVVPEDEN